MSFVLDTWMEDVEPWIFDVVKRRENNERCGFRGYNDEVFDHTEADTSEDDDSSKDEESSEDED
jgi:hypothetical protein